MTVKVRKMQNKSFIFLNPSTHKSEKPQEDIVLGHRKQNRLRIKSAVNNKIRKRQLV